VTAFFVQMSGAPGAGKTAVARPLGARLGAVIIDFDVVKSALLDGAVEYAAAGPLAYRVVWAIAQDVASLHQSLIVDSPCYYDEILERGQAIARAAGMRYRYVECVVDDLDEIDRRLKSRRRLRSQRGALDAPPRDLGADPGETGAALFCEWIANMKRPGANALRLDTSRPVEIAVEEALAFVTRSNDS